jgi:hypothetical protein
MPRLADVPADVVTAALSPFLSKRDMTRLFSLSRGFSMLAIQRAAEMQLDCQYAEGYEVVQPQQQESKDAAPAAAAKPRRKVLPPTTKAEATDIFKQSFWSCYRCHKEFFVARVQRTVVVCEHHWDECKWMDDPFCFCDPARRCRSSR